MANQARLYNIVPLLRAAEQSSQEGHHAAVGAYNINFYAQAEGVVEGLKRTDSPGIIQASKGANKFQGGPDKLQYMLFKAATDLGYDVPMALHLDHGNEKAAKECIEKGYSSVMIDGSGDHITENFGLTEKITALAHEKGLSTEGELGQLAGVEEDVEHEFSKYADPVVVPAFFRLTGVDALAVAYGTSHGPTKGRTDLVNLNIVADSYARLRNDNLNEDHFLVGHGSSTVPSKYVALINEYGGNLSDTSGVPEAILKQGRYVGLRKFNIDTDLRLAMTGYVRKWVHENADAAESSELVSKIKGTLDGKLPAYDKNGEQVKPEEITDPRSWLTPIVESNPDALREHYKDTGDEAFIELMGVVKETVAEHVAYLNDAVFNNKGLAEKVEGQPFATIGKEDVASLLKS